jgi:uncharacterized protein YbaR (Trm112 family)
MIDPQHLALLACPLCPERPPLRLEGDHLVCPCRKAFPIIDGIPHLVREEAKDWKNSEETPPQHHE